MRALKAGETRVVAGDQLDRNLEKTFFFSRSITPRERGARNRLIDVDGRWR